MTIPATTLETHLLVISSRQVRRKELADACEVPRREWVRATVPEQETYEAGDEKRGTTRITRKRVKISESVMTDTRSAWSFSVCAMFTWRCLSSSFSEKYCFLKIHVLNWFFCNEKVR